ncbi:MAG: hypothetical protein M3Q59_06100, partial [Actinomycetota bacterium]|nr:hypothetical protein [Actinomycetota bacterium]
RDPCRLEHREAAPLSHIPARRRLVLRALTYAARVLGPGDSVPEVQVWTAPREESRPLGQVLGAGYALLCFYLWD